MAAALAIASRLSHGEPLMLMIRIGRAGSTEPIVKIENEGYECEVLLKTLVILGVITVCKETIVLNF
jgi:hypothetical protein